MRLYNTLTRKKEEFVPLEAGKVKMYACGPTVYNFIHVGNGRPICVFDVLRRYLEYKGYTVAFVQNFTDVDDKIINRANSEGVSFAEIARRYIGEYLTDAKGLGVREASVHPRATEAIGDIIGLVSALMEKGCAYQKGGSVYFRSASFERYGRLSNQPLEELEAGSRADVSGDKENPLDFALWKAAKPGEPSWESPWGQGRPGWHIECSAMARKHLGDTIDIHCGGQDLIFPHHENEIAQSECCTGKPYVRYWLHNGYINVDNRKMSKSEGNFFTIRDVAEKYGYEPIKFMMLAAHYRSPINYSLDVIKQSKSALERLYNCRANLDYVLNNPGEGDGAEPWFYALLEESRDAFVKAMDDDLNTADGIAALFDLARDLNTCFCEPRPRVMAESACALFDEICDVLGILYNRAAPKSLDAEIRELIEERQQARKDRNYTRADEIRDILAARGVRLEDTPQGVKYRLEKGEGPADSGQKSKNPRA